MPSYRSPATSAPVRCTRSSGAAPGQRLGENFTNSGQSVLELLNRMGADGWELADREERQEHGDGPSYWDPNRTVTIYTFKYLVPS
jgi:hypothetical protein